MPRDLSWWVWTITAACLVAGLSGHPVGFHAAILISAIQTVVYDFKEASAFTFPVQVRLAYTVLLILCQLPFLNWLYWLPAVGTFALVLFGYCLMARILSLLPWNRVEPLSLNLIRRTFLTPPELGNVHHGLPAGGCPGGRHARRPDCDPFRPHKDKEPGLITNQFNAINHEYHHGRSSGKWQGRNVGKPSRPPICAV
jgi:hypothetical protein